MDDLLSAQYDDWCVSRLVDEKLRPMSVSIERKLSPHWPTVTHRPEHPYSAHPIESVAGMREGCAAWLRIMS